MDIYTYYIAYDYASNHKSDRGAGSLITTRGEIKTSQDIKDVMKYIRDKTDSEVVIIKFIHKLEATDEEIQCFLQNSEGIDNEDEE